MSKLLKNYVGIDISKPFFDVAVYKSHPSGPVTHHQFKQSQKGFTEMNEWLKQQEVLPDEETLFCMEYMKALVWMEMAIKIKKSEGFVRGSNDKSDAIKIAMYAFRFQDKKQLWKPVDASLNKIKYLIAQRDRIVSSITRLTVPLNELKEIGCVEEAHQMEKLQKTVMSNLEKMQKNIEAAIAKAGLSDFQREGFRIRETLDRRDSREVVQADTRRRPKHTSEVDRAVRRVVDPDVVAASKRLGVAVGAQGAGEQDTGHHHAEDDQAEHRHGQARPHAVVGRERDLAAVKQLRAIKERIGQQRNG